jgi:hypothetical protein
VAEKAPTKGLSQKYPQRSWGIVHTRPTGKAAAPLLSCFLSRAPLAARGARERGNTGTVEADAAAGRV